MPNVTYLMDFSFVFHLFEIFFSSFTMYKRRNFISCSSMKVICKRLVKFVYIIFCYFFFSTLIRIYANSIFNKIYFEPLIHFNLFWHIIHFTMDGCSRCKQNFKKRDLNQLSSVKLKFSTLLVFGSDFFILLSLSLFLSSLVTKDTSNNEC